MFAELDANGIAVIVAAVFLGIQQIYAMYLASKRAAATAAKVEEVKTTLQDATIVQDERAEKHEQKLDNLTTIAVKTEKHTNGLVEQLQDASFAAGVKSEKDKGK